MDGGGREVSDRQGSGDKRVEELLRVNAELAAELRALSQARADAPRPGPIPAARGLARLEGERDELAARLEESERKLAETQAHREGLERQNQAMAAQIARLRLGLPGFLRRARARLLSRGGGA
jgi:chromosome segregation ATPase